MIKLIQILCFLIFCLKTPLLSQVENIEKDIKFNSNELNKIRKEISDYENKIKKTSGLEKNEIEKLNDIDEEISLVRNLIFRLRQEEKSHNNSINFANKEIQILQTDQKKLIERYSKRIIKAYKKGTLSNIEKIIDSNSWKQAIYRSKYIKIISNYDKNLHEKIINNMDQISKERESIKQKLENLNLIDKEKSSRKKWLEQRRKTRNSRLENLKRDRQQMSMALLEKKKAADEMRDLIETLEKEKALRLAELEKLRQEKKIISETEITNMKGKLPWPIDGNIISKFGTFQNPNLKTITENTGIDIKAKDGTEVRSVFDGIVTTITYIRGYGNTVILDHGSNFYTVYTHVSDVEVEENSYVEARQVIAYVSDSGSLEGSKLHFEIWGNREKLNPELWLLKK
ncbi:MAG: hypothetical protein CMG48_01385 [Candidatus Marinimicrobia bacterium]|nr:hypothetical protein [Candidatus Neomarinimicrobiota bacterium]